MITDHDPRPRGLMNKSITAILEALDDLEPEPDQVAVAARRLIDSDELVDPWQRTREIYADVGPTIDPGCVRCGRADAVLDLVNEWFCRPCRLYVLEITDEAPRPLPASVGEQPQPSDPFHPDYWHHVDTPRPAPQSPGISPLVDCTPWMTRAEARNRTSLPTIDELTPETWGQLRSQFDEAFNAIAAAFAEPLERIAAAFAAVRDATSRQTPPDYDGPTAPCEVCCVEVPARNRAERRHPRCSEHPRAGAREDPRTTNYRG